MPKVDILESEQERERDGGEEGKDGELRERSVPSSYINLCLCPAYLRGETPC